MADYLFSSQSSRKSNRHLQRQSRPEIRGLLVCRTPFKSLRPSNSALSSPSCPKSTAMLILRSQSMFTGGDILCLILELILEDMPCRTKAFSRPRRQSRNALSPCLLLLRRFIAVMGLLVGSRSNRQVSVKCCVRNDGHENVCDSFQIHRKREADSPASEEYPVESPSRSSILTCDQLFNVYQMAGKICQQT
jgi:hypothetical protein